jgi:cation diffusion facilitator family transporter
MTTMKHVHLYDLNDKLVIKATIASMAVAIITIISKVVAWLSTDSSSILASLTDSLLDFISSFINFIAARYALQPPDEEHRFGHGKAEDLAILVQSSFFVISGLFVIGVAVKKIIFPQPVDNSFIGMGLMSFSIFTTLLLVLYQSYVIKNTYSMIVKADRLHYFVDFFTNSAVIASLLISEIWNNKIIDPIFALTISAYMLFQAGKLFTGAFRNLMDHELSDEAKNKLKSIILSHPDVKGFHDLKTRYSGSKPIIQFHLEMDGNVSLYKAHNIAETVEEMIKKKFKRAEVIIHQDPEDIVEEREFHSI